MDCVKACPQKDTNTVRGGTWWPPVVLVVAFFLALLIAQQNPMATLSERWGNYEQADSLGRVDKVVFDEMKTVKCFGSAYSLYSKMKRKPGIIGMDCWASKNKVTLYYNSTKLNETAVRKIVFTPTKYKIRTVGKGETAPERLLGYKMGVLGLWDGVDNIYMYRLLQKKDGIYGFKTEFGEPVLVTFYFDPEIVGLSHIDSLLDLRKYQYESKGEMVTQKINFKVEGREGYVDTLSYLDFSRRFFSGYDRGFNNYRDHIKDDIMIFEIDFPQVESSTVQRRLSYLTSHLSFDEGIVRMKTLITDKPVLRVYFLPEKTDANKIMMLLSAEKLKYMTRDGSEKETENIFEFEGDHRLFPR